MRKTLKSPVLTISDKHAAVSSTIQTTNMLNCPVIQTDG